jgi:hypothetical protein
MRVGVFHGSNHQWAVTDFGLEAVKPGASSKYPIPAERLTDKGGADDSLYIWPWHMAEKTWIDMDAFIEAFRKALEFHRNGEVDQEIFDKSITVAYARIAQDREARNKASDVPKSRFERLRSLAKDWKI